ncbi:unnamed protein product [Didymodactylos carnosus]|uniref:Uncharacterized protein n=1 Tax=Didymodactylos carnosus TaxID=1234261 RepID=A0A814L7C1_9BILA|nr:unnamed protein product [Didymodactylos carnosus]CAF1062158.1 unnamed protein product [Didymodactylos carnosus]CAF3819787.1 unnamed protein product [Didymodactylos carnosus]CAF3830390.1 unnamed protein product [Didymodactylos carnosus]
MTPEIVENFKLQVIINPTEFRLDSGAKTVAEEEQDYTSCNNKLTGKLLDNESEQEQEITELMVSEIYTASSLRQTVTLQIATSTDTLLHINGKNAATENALQPRLRVFDRQRINLESHQLI